MKADIIVDQETQKVKLILDWKAGIVGPNLTADDAEISITPCFNLG
ncbi:MAG: hypothetical protein FWH27_02790 [Planctomycetaceae bacterium]|nr:hypothetical protein [Planctomycetaceae bacterium]